MKFQLLKAKIKKILTHPKIISGILIGVILNFLLTYKASAALFGLDSVVDKAIEELDIDKNKLNPMIS